MVVCAGGQFDAVDIDPESAEVSLVAALWPCTVSVCVRLVILRL